LEPLLIDVLPLLANEVKNIFINKSRIDLANQVNQLRIKKLCECGDPDCGSFYLTQYEEDDNEIEGFAFQNGTIEVFKGKIGFIEIFPSNDGYKIRRKLKQEGILY
jgi:hypothetical protein